MPVMDQAFWDERYRSADAVWSGRPNPHLVTEAADLVPGRALDVGCGEGADAIWLAGRGWHVTAVDISPVALERGAAHAAEVGAEHITWWHADLTAEAPPTGRYDLVSAHFLHLPPGLRVPLYRRLADAVAPGGVLLVVAHHPEDLQTSARRPPVPELFFTAADIAATLEPAHWTVLVEDARPRTILDPDGNPVTVKDAVLLARRTS